MKNVVIAMLAGPLSCTLAWAQDSTAKIQGCVSGACGDAVEPWELTEQINNYIVEMTKLETEWGINFGIAPLAKSNIQDRGTATRFNTALLAQGVSRNLLTGMPYPASNYMRWDGPGYGINDNAALNDPGTLFSPQGLSAQFAATFAEFDGSAPGPNVVTTVVNYDPERPGELAVSRIIAAQYGPNHGQVSASIALGSVDASGNTYIRADDNAAFPPDEIFGQNIFRIDTLSRSAGAINQINVFGASDTADWLVTLQGIVHATPSAIPAGVATRPVYLGGTSLGTAEIAHEVTPGFVSYTSAHLSGSPDHRGNVSWNLPVFFPGSVGTAAMIGKDNPVDLDSRDVLLWGTDINGAVSGSCRLIQPVSLIDNADGTVWPASGLAIDEFQHHVSQVVFTGGNGQVAVGEDTQARVLVATTFAADTTPIGTYFGENPINAIGVARFASDAPCSGVEWTTAAWVDDAGGGKPILDGPGGQPVGKLIQLNALTGGSPVGPSMSSPMIDSAGNVWFVGAIELSVPGTRHLALLRAVYDPSSFSFELDRVLNVGQRFMGRNSNTEYELAFMPLADGNSISSSAVWSGNMLQSAHSAMDSLQLSPVDPRTLGGLVFTGEIIYDVNGDGAFERVTGTGGNPASLDQEYHVLFYLGALSRFARVDASSKVRVPPLSQLSPQQ